MSSRPERYAPYTRGNCNFRLIAVAEDRMRFVELLQSLDLVFGQLQFQRGERILEVPGLAGADDRRGDGRLREDPCERDLGRLNVAFLGNRNDAVDDIEVTIAVVAAVAELVGACAGRFGLSIAALARTGEESAGERAPRDAADALIEAKRNHLALFLAVDEVVVVLHAEDAGEGGLA